jgi:hypothetical protein
VAGFSATVDTMGFSRVVGAVCLSIVLTAACGGDSEGDPDAGPLCGNGVLDAFEDCDPGIDPVMCTDACVIACGDGIVQPTEECDTAIAAGTDGACPTDVAECDDEDVCTTDTIMGSECQARCDSAVVDFFVDNDGCCPDIADNIALNDFDCAAVCGNGIVEMGETCDTGISTGPGSCPAIDADCDDGQACTDDAFVAGANACQATCAYTVRTTIMNDDGCCPPMADFATDNDCAGETGLCGNGVRNGGLGETCDTAIADGMPGSCPLECIDPDPCNNPLLLSAGTCNALCWDVPVTDPINDDMCCPVFEGANNRNDNDCTTSCGTAAEECDAPGIGDCDVNCRIVRTAFRLTSISIADPHIYWLVPPGNVNCADLTTVANDTIFPGNITGDADMDGFADLTILNSFKPFDQSLPTNDLELVFGDCLPNPDPAATTCTADPLTERIVTTATNMDTGTCLGTLPNTLTPEYTPPLEPVGPCFVSDSFTGDLLLGSLTIPIEDAYTAATYNGDPADGMIDGMIRGFVSETAAMGAVIPDTVLLIGGLRLYDILAGGIQEPCDIGMGVIIGDDRDVGPDMVTMGWYFYVNYTAEIVPFDDKPNAGN